MKKFVYLFGFFIAFSIHNQVSAEESGDLESFREAIRKKYDLKENAFLENNPLPIVNEFYTADAISTGPDGTFVKGRKALLEEYKKHIQDKVRIVSLHSFVNEDTGWDWAHFYVQPADPGAEPYALTILFLWERINGEWWSHGEMFVMGAVNFE